MTGFNVLPIRFSSTRRQDKVDRQVTQERCSREVVCTLPGQGLHSDEFHKACKEFNETAEAPGDSPTKIQSEFYNR